MGGNNIKTPIILVGSGQHARVVMYNIKEQGKYEVIGILDNDPLKIATNIDGIEVIGSYECNLVVLREALNTDLFFIGFGSMRNRAATFQKFINSGWNSVNIIHPNAVISSGATLGTGILIECGCLITPNPIIGNNVVINTGSQVNHDNVIEDHVYIASGVVLSGGVHIGENTLIDDGVIVALGKNVGANCLVGAGSVVTKDLENDYIYYGNPVRKIRKVDSAI